jgi:hypothetical protein
MIGLTPDIASVVVVDHGVLHLTFQDGVTGEVAVLERMRGPVFDEARTPAGFAKADQRARSTSGSVPERGPTRPSQPDRKRRTHACRSARETQHR